MTTALGMPSRDLGIPGPHDEMETTFLRPLGQLDDATILAHQLGSERPRPSIKSGDNPQPQSPNRQTLETFLLHAPSCYAGGRKEPTSLDQPRNNARQDEASSAPRTIADATLLSHNTSATPLKTSRAPLTTFLHHSAGAPPSVFIGTRQRPTSLPHYKYQSSAHSSTASDMEGQTPARKIVPPHLRTKNTTPPIVPPHLRPKNTTSARRDSCQITPTQPTGGDKAGAAPNNDHERREGGVQVPPAQLDGASIYEKLEEHGVKVTSPKRGDPSVLSSQPCPSESPEKADQSAGSPNPPGTWADVARTFIPPSEPQAASHSKRDEARGRGRGRGRGSSRGGGSSWGRPPRTSKWPDKNASKPDPDRWAINWDENNDDHHDNRGGWSDSIKSACADAGFGTGKRHADNDASHQLADWDGNWAPAPLNWNSRPAFRDNQSEAQIERWLDGTHEAMLGQDYSVSMQEVCIDGTTYGFVGNRIDHTPMSDLVPRHWKPVVFGKQSPQIFWNELMRSSDPEPLQPDDLEGVSPWWECYQSMSSGCSFLKAYEAPDIQGIDPDETPDERIARGNDYGSQHHTDNRKRTEKAKREAQQEKARKKAEKAKKLSHLQPLPENQEKIKPGLNLYIRSAKPADIARIRDIYNHYVNASVCVPETSQRTTDDMLSRYKTVRGNNLPFLVACERGGKLDGRRRRNHYDQDDPITLPDTVVGFAFADDYNDLRGMYRFTAEAEVYVDTRHYMKGIAKCLLDKLVGLLDPEYLERGGYGIVGDDMEGIGEFQRLISNLVVNFPYEKPERLEWVERWLVGWLGFRRAGHLEGVGVKNGKRVNLAIFQRPTGTKIDEANPPVTMQYPT